MQCRISDLSHDRQPRVEVIPDFFEHTWQRLVLAEFIQEFAKRVNCVNKRMRVNKWNLVRIGTRHDSKLGFSFKHPTLTFQSNPIEITIVEFAYLLP